MKTEARPSSEARPAELVGWLAALVALALLLLAVVLPRAVGASTYTVLSSSMEPKYPPGTLVIVRPVPVAELASGDVITYQLASGRSAVVTHRIVAVDVSGGERRFLTQGDANSSPDPEHVRPVQVNGRMWYALPHVGRLATVGPRWAGDLVADASVVALLAYAAWQILRGRREARR